MRKLPTGALLVLVSLVVLAALPTTPAQASTSTVELHVYDAAGNRLTFNQFRALQENGAGANGDNDMLLDPTTLAVTTAWPLYQGDTGDPAFDWPGTATTLSMAWPNSDGYSNLLLDVPGPGIYN